MTEVLAAVEAIRRREQLTQQSVARDLGMTQGHYSKVAKALVPLSGRSIQRMEAWLDSRSAPGTSTVASVRMRELAASIQQQCSELVGLIEGVAKGSA